MEYDLLQLSAFEELLEPVPRDEFLRGLVVGDGPIVKAHADFRQASAPSSQLKIAVDCNVCRKAVKEVELEAAYSTHPIHRVEPVLQVLIARVRSDHEGRLLNEDVGCLEHRALHQEADGREKLGARYPIRVVVTDLNWVDEVLIPGVVAGVCQIPLSAHSILPDHVSNLYRELAFGFDVVDQHLRGQSRIFFAVHRGRLAVFRVGSLTARVLVVGDDDDRHLENVSRVFRLMQKM